jgi:hypothetical protein
MDWPQLRELAETGFDIESHSAGHGYLPALTPAHLGEDFARSR